MVDQDLESENMTGSEKKVWIRPDPQHWLDLRRNPAKYYGSGRIEMAMIKLAFSKIYRYIFKLLDIT